MSPASLSTYSMHRTSPTSETSETAATQCGRCRKWKSSARCRSGSMHQRCRALSCDATSATCTEKPILLVWQGFLQYKEIAPVCSRSLLLTGYRPETSPWGCVKSCFYLHNESVNIWSHLLGAMLFGFGAYGELEASGGEWSYCAAYCSAVTFCFVCSSIFHIFNNVQRLHTAALIGDLCGIFCLVIASVGSHTYMAFGRNPIYGIWPLAHTCMCAVVAVVSCAILCFRVATCSDPAKHGALKGVLPAVLLGCSFSYWLVAVAHVASVEGAEIALKLVGLIGPEWLAWAGGMTIWKLRYPEAAFPYTFDFFFSSHNIHHIACVFNAIWHVNNMCFYIENLLTIKTIYF